MMVPNLTSTGSGGGIPGPRGPAGEDGDSAYEIAVAEGFVGTESEWIASLKGAPGDLGEPGVDGKSVELQKSETAIQWRQEGGEFADLVQLSEITGPPGEGGSGGEGTIVSVNGQTGPDVVLDAEDVGAASDADLSALAGLLTELETELTALDADVDGKQAANASLAAIAAFSTAGSLETRTARLNFPTGGGGAVYAFGRNARNSGGQMQGLQIGGGVETDGIHGVYLAPDGHGSWMRAQPSRNYSPIESVLYATAAQGFATKVNGTNQFTLTSGSPGDAANWVGEKFYWEGETYRVSAVSGSTVSVTTTTGGAVTHSGTASGVFHLFWVEATGTCAVSGSTVTRVSGDPFLAFINDSSHRFWVNNVQKTVTAFNSPESLTISSPPSAGTYSYRQRMDVDDTMTQFRIQKFFGDYEENLTLGAKPWGYFIRAQGFSPTQGYRPLWLGSGENKSQLALMPNGTIRIGDHGKIRAPNTDSFNYLEIDGGTAGQYSPTIRGRGPDTNVGIAMDTKGTGEFVVTGGSFGKFLIRANLAGIGFNGAAAQVPPSLGAAATNSTSDVQRVVNAIRSCLIANGLATS